MRVPSHGICALDTLSTMCTLLLAWTMALAVQAADPPRPMEEIDGDAYCFAPSSDASVQGDYLLADNPILHEGRIKAWTVKLKPFLASDPSIMDPSIPVIVRVYRPAHLDQDPRQAPTYRVVAEANLLREAVQQDGRFWERPEMTRTLHVDPPMDVRPGDVIGYQNVGVFGLHARPPFGPFTPYTW